MLVPVGGAARPAPIAPRSALLAHAVVPLSSREVDYPVLRDAYDNSSLDSEAEVLDWREQAAAAQVARSRHLGRRARPDRRAAAPR